jgi:hypothetical protein
MASLMASKWVGLVMTRSIAEQSFGGLPVHINTGVNGDRSLMICAISPPVMSGMELSVKTRLCRMGLKISRASCAESTESTSYPKLLRNILVKRRVSILSSTRSTVFDGCSEFCCTILWLVSSSRIFEVFCRHRPLSGKFSE